MFCPYLRTKYHGFAEEIGIYYHQVKTCIQMMQDLLQHTIQERVDLHFK